MRTVIITAGKLDIKRNEKANLRIINEGTLTVGLDTEITPELLMEGNIRDLIRGVQNSRKQMGFSVTDRIKLTVFGSGSLKAAWDDLYSSVAEETLATEASWAKVDGQISMEAGDNTWLVKIELAGSK
jgi:isoleucyl-tRNA synthetase